MNGTSKTCKAETQYRLTISLNNIMKGIKGVSFEDWQMKNICLSLVSTYVSYRECIYFWQGNHSLLTAFYSGST